MKVGIDLGTTYSTVARYNQTSGKPEIINNLFGKELTPSVICFLDNGDMLVGEDAKDMQAGGTGSIAASFKRSMGDNNFEFDGNGRSYSAEDLSAILLKNLIDDAQNQSGEKIDSVVITVPAYFNDFQRKATIRAGEACGVKVLKIINEPTAAAISYGYNKAADKTILVYDLGGGTFDVTIVQVSQGRIQVKGTDGNHLLGGKDWDNSIVDYLCEHFEDEFGMDPRNDPATFNELIVAAEGYKKLLTKAENITAVVKYEGNAGKYTLTRSQFDSKTEFLLNTTSEVCEKLFADIGMGWSDIDEILLVGGSTRMPQVSEYLKRVSKKPVVAHSDTDLAVAKGAALAAEQYNSQNTGLREMQITDVTAHSLGALSVSPDGSTYINEIMIKRNSKVPSSVRKSFRIEDGNLTDRIEVYTLQGESKCPLDCYVLAKVLIKGFNNDGRGTTVDIEYTYDDNGVVQVAAFQNGRALEVIPEAVPDDIGWMGEPPSANIEGTVVSNNIVVCVDLSRSMKTSIDDVKEAIRGFVDQLRDTDTKFGLVGFGDKVKIIRDISPDPNVMIGALDDLKVNMLGRGTDGSPFGTAQLMLTTRPGGKMIVVLTDGIWGKKDFAISEAMSCRNARIAIVSIGFGEADAAFLRQIATVDEGAMYTTLNNLGETFSTIATAISTGNMGLRESSMDPDSGRLGTANRGRISR